MQLIKEFSHERLQKKSTTSIWAPLKRARLKVTKKSNTNAPKTIIQKHSLEKEVYYIMMTVV